MLAAEAATAASVGAVGLIGAMVVSDSALRVAGVPLTSPLSAVMLAIAVCAASAMIHRRAAKLFTAGVSTAAVALTVICAVAAAHHDPGPLGFTAPAVLMWAAVFSYNLALLMWLLPDQIQGPEWLRRRGNRRHIATADTANPDTATWLDGS
jgi:peptidoglycan/LPS O-acetylase OafA/YrhL